MAGTMRDLRSNIVAESAFSALVSTDTSTSGTWVDTSGFHGLTLVMTGASYTDGEYTLLLRESDSASMSSTSTVSSTYLVGTYASTKISGSDVSTIGYVGNKRFVGVKVSSGSTTSGAHIQVNAILSEPENAPTSQQSRQ